MKILIIFLFAVFSFQSIFSQTFTEKKLAEIPGTGKLDLYSFKSDPKTGAYVYGQFDTIANKFTILTGKGNSSQYDYFVNTQSLFDDNGNCYSIVYNNLTDTTFTYYLLKNAESVASFDYINESWIQRDGILYFSCKEKDKYCIASYNMNDGKLTRGKQYDEIIPCYIKNTGEYEGEGEPTGELAFTNDGKLYYIAGSGDEKFLVIGDAEQKHYSDIEMFTFTQDKNGVFTYIARDKGKFYETPGNTFVVQGDKEYKRYPYVYGPIIFDANNTPIYIAADSLSFQNPQRLVIGDKEEKLYSGGISDIKFTPAGKLAYIASNIKISGDTTYEYYVVTDGKEGKKYSNIYLLSFLPGDEPLYTAYKGDNECFIIRGKSQQEYDYPSIMTLKALPSGKTFFVGVIYGDYNRKIKDKYFVHIGEEQYGPYEGITVSDYVNGEYLRSDNAGNFAFISQKLKSWKDYTYSYRVISNNGENDEHEFIENLVLYNGKPLYTASDDFNSETGKSKYKVYYDNKSVGSTYDGLSDFKFDSSTGTANFYTIKKNAFYLVEMKF